MKGVTAGNVIFTTFDENFNSHAREGRDFGSGKTSAMVYNFNSHAREGRDLYDTEELIDNLLDISTHTPVKGVTIIHMLPLIKIKFQLTRP